MVSVFSRLPQILWVGSEFLLLLEGCSLAGEQQLRTVLRVAVRLGQGGRSGLSRVPRRETHGIDDDREAGLPAARIRERQGPAGEGFLRWSSGGHEQ